MLTRKIGKIIRGNVSPFQIYSACVLGSLIGFLPSIGNAPGLYGLYFILVFILNANLFIAAMVGLLSKLVYFVTLPVLFSFGTFLVEGPLNSSLSVLANAPVLAWFGFEYYVTVSGILLALVCGSGAGFLITRTLRKTRHRLANLEEGSEKFQKITANPFVKFIAWILLGGIKGKKTWKELDESKKGLPFRPLGLVGVLLAGVFLFFLAKFFDQSILTAYLRDSMTRINGATVDVESVALDMRENQITLTGLAMADPEALEKNRFESALITADLSGMNLLAKRVVIDQLIVDSPKSGTERQLKGTRYVDTSTPIKEKAREGVHSILDWIKGEGKWQERLQTLQTLYAKVSPYMGEEEDKAETADSSGEGEAFPQKRSFKQRLADEAERLGYANVTSSSLIRENPRLVINRFEALNLEVESEGSSLFYDVKGQMLSDNPRLLKERGKLSVSGKSQSLEISVTLPNNTITATGIFISRENLAVSEVADQLKDPSKFPLNGGTISLTGEGIIDQGSLNVPVRVEVLNTKIQALGQSTSVSRLPIEIQLRGPIGSPQLKIPTDALSGVLKEAGKEKLKSTVKEKLGDKVGEGLKGFF